MDLGNRKVQFLSLSIIVIILFSIFTYYAIDNHSKDKKTIINNEKIDILESYNLSKDWLITNINSQGYFNYYYDPINDESSTSNNMIRQLMASRVLSELAQKNSSLKNLNKKNIEYIFSNWYKEDGDYGYIYFSSKSKLGAMAMMIRTIIYSPYFENYSTEAKKLVNTVLFLQNNDGSFEPWYIEPAYSYDKEYLLTFYSGEAILALVEYYEKTKDQNILDSAVFSQNFYIKKYVENLSKNYYPAYVPWHTQSLNKIYKITGEKKYADAIFVLNDELLKIQDKKNNETLGRFYNISTPQYGSPHSSSDAVYTEGLTYAYEIADLIDDKNHKEKYLEAIRIGSLNLIKLQYNESNSKGFIKPNKIIGAIRINKDNSDIRVDTTQHTIDAFGKILEIF